MSNFPLAILGSEGLFFTVNIFTVSALKEITHIHFSHHGHLFKQTDDQTAGGTGS